MQPYPENPEVEADYCKKCGSKNINETPTIIKCEDGTTEKNYDTQNAKCLDCGKEWLVVYI